MGVNFYLEKRANRKGERPIRIQVCFRGVARVTTTGISIDPRFWKGARVSRSKYRNSKALTGAEINMQLNKIEDSFLQWAKSLRGRPDARELADEFAVVLGRKKMGNHGSYNTSAPGHLFARLDEFVARESEVQEWAPKTVQSWMNFRHLLRAFKSDLSFEDLDESGIERFVTFLRQDKGQEDSTVRKEYKKLRCFVKWNLRKGYANEDAIIQYKPKFKVPEKPVIFLTVNELKTLYHYEIPKTGSVVTLKGIDGEPYNKTVSNSVVLGITRDLFCFCSLTSLRFSDMQHLKKKDIVDDSLLITTQKTNDRIQIELNQYSKDILQKYSHTSSMRALPYITNRRMNRCLKELCELCGFNEPVSMVFFRGGKKVEETHPKWELMSTHAGRKTFVCLALSCGIPPQVVMKWTGHSDYKAMQPYIDIAEKTKADAMEFFSKSLKM